MSSSTSNIQSTSNLAQCKQAANALRILSAECVQKADSGHPGLPMGAADLAFVLWTHFLKHDPKDPQWPDRDALYYPPGMARCFSTASFT